MIDEDINVEDDDIDLSDDGADSIDVDDEPKGLAALGASGPTAREYANLGRAGKGGREYAGVLASYLSAVDKAIGADPSPMTDDERAKFFKEILPMAGTIATMVGTGRLGLLPRVAANLAAPAVTRSIGRGLYGEGTTLDQLKEEVISGIPMGTAAATNALPSIVRLASSLAAGKGTRELLGREGTWGDVAVDLADPALYSVGRDVGRGIQDVRRGLMSDLPDYEKTFSLRESLKPLNPVVSHVEDVGVERLPAEELKNIKFLTRYAQKAFSGPISRAERSTDPRLNELAREMTYYSTGKPQQFDLALEGARSRIAQAVAKLKDPKQVSLLTGRQPEMVGPPREEYFEAAADPDVVRAAEEVGAVTRDLGDIGEDIGFFTPEAPRLEHYDLPLSEVAGPGARAKRYVEGKTYSEHMGPERGFIRRMKPHERRGTYDPRIHEGDPRKRFDEWVNMYATPYKAAASFGPKSASTTAKGVRGDATMLEVPKISEGVTSTEKIPVGRNAAAQLGRLRAADQAGELSAADKRTLELLEDSFKQIYVKEPASSAVKGAGILSQALSTALLARAGVRQVGQTGWNVARYGFGKTARGLTRSALDPSYSRFLEQTGAGATPLQSYFEEMNPGNNNLVGRSIGAFEKFNRTTASAGGVPHIEDLIRRNNAGETSDALIREMREAGLTPGKYIEPNAETIASAFRNVVGRTQQMANAPGFSSYEMIGDPLGRVGFQYTPFRMGAYRELVDDVLRPLRKGPVNSDFWLATDRLARLVPAGLAATAIGETMAGIQTGDILTSEGRERMYGSSDNLYTTIPRRALETYGGLPASLATSVGGVAADYALNNGSVSGRRLANALVDPVTPPLASVVSDADWGSLLPFVGALANPKWASRYSMVAPLIKNILSEMPAVAEEEPPFPPTERPYLNIQTEGDPYLYGSTERPSLLRRR